MLLHIANIWNSIGSHINFSSINIFSSYKPSSGKPSDIDSNKEWDKSKIIW